MDIVVCVKHVPDTTEAEIAIRDDGRGIKREGLVFDISEADNYAIEEALVLKEEFDGAVTVLTVGPEGADETLRMCLAKGADQAVRLTDEVFEGSDGYATARILAEAIKDMDYDLVLTGCQADDGGAAQVGVTLAEMLGIPHAALVVSTEAEEDEDRMTVHRELEGGLHEVLEINLPALLTIQTGINEPRYASIFGIRKAMKKQIEVLDLDDLELAEEAVGEAGSKTSLVKLFIPVVTTQATILEGSPEEVSGELVTIFKNEGVI